MSTAIFFLETSDSVFYLLLFLPLWLLQSQKPLWNVKMEKKFSFFFKPMILKNLL